MQQHDRTSASRGILSCVHQRGELLITLQQAASHVLMVLGGCDRAITRQMVVNDIKCRDFCVVFDLFLRARTSGPAMRTTVGRVPKKKHRSRHSSQRSGHPARRAVRRRPQWDLLDEAEAALAAEHPMAMLQLASALLELMDPRSDDPFDHSPKTDRVEMPELMTWLSGSAEPAAAALAWTMAHVNGDEVLQARVVRDLGTPNVLLPAWLHQLGKIEIVAAEQVTEQMRDGYEVIIHARLAGYDLTAVTFIDFNLGGIVKDTFVTDRPIESFNELWKQHADTRHTTLEALPLAEARAWINGAIELGARTWPTIETEDWPASRPLLEWLLRHLPEGGTGFVRPEWSSADRSALADRFLASPYGAAHHGADNQSIIGDLIWYRADYGYGDPCRWSPIAIEILMLDWYPRKVIADQPYLRQMPAVLRDFVRFVHGEVALDDDLTTEALDAIDLSEHRYQETIASRGDDLGDMAIRSTPL